MERDYTLAIAAASILLADELRSCEQKVERKIKKKRVVDRKLSALREAYPERCGTVKRCSDVKALLAGDWPKDEAQQLIIDLAFSNPFAPYELTFKDSDLTKGLTKVAHSVGLMKADVERIRATQREAMKAHRHIDWKRIAIYGIGGTVVVAAGGWALAPAIGTAIGGAAGLSGAAATAHGLAILGGGSLAIGGAGMAGGMWLITGAGAAAGLLGAAGSTALMQLGAATVKVELMKLQVSFKENVLRDQVELKKSQEVVKQLVSRQGEIEKALSEERKLNDRNSGRLKELEAKVTALEDAIEWMKEQEAA